MNLPERLHAEFVHGRGHRPDIAVRSIYDLRGELGETYLAADVDGLILFSRPISGAAETHQFGWPDIRQLNVRSDHVFSYLELQTAAGQFALQFSGWDGASLRTLVELWKAHRGTNGASAGLDGSGASGTGLGAGETAAAVPPLIAFCAALHALIESDGIVEPAELNCIARGLQDAAAIEAGHQFLHAAGVDGVSRALQSNCTPAQRECAFANLIAAAMIDGSLSTEEQHLLDRFQAALGVEDARRQEIFDVLMAKNNLAVFAETEPDAGSVLDGLTPVVAYCAALWAMITADETVLAGEQELLAQTVPYPDEIRCGQEYIQAHGVEGLLARLPQVLTMPQRLCVYANLLAVAMVDGALRGVEQELLERFQRAMALSDADATRLYSVLLLKNCLGVFEAVP